MLVRQRTESVGAEVDERLHVVFREATVRDLALVIHGVVVGVVVLALSRAGLLLGLAGFSGWLL